MKVVSALCLSLFFSIIGAVPAGAANPAVDSAGNSYYIVDMGPPSYRYSVVKISPLGELIFQSPLNIRSQYPVAIAIDPAGYIYIAGTANFVTGPGSEVNEGYEGFVAKLTPDATGVIYETFVGGSIIHGLDLAVDALGQAYLHYSIGYGGYTSVAIFSPAGSLSGWYSGSSGYLTAMALGPSGDLLTVGWVFSEFSRWEVYLGRMDASSGAVTETLIDRGTLSWFVDVAATPGDGAVVVGTKSEGLYVAEFGPAGEEIFSRVLNVGTVGTFDVAVTSSGEIVVNGSTGSRSFVLRLEGGTGKVIFSSMNLPPDCSGATASPSVIWPPNGKMVPVSILGVTDSGGDAVAVKVTGIIQDEPGAAFSGIGSPAAQVKAERDGKGDGRVYRIEFEAADPSGASCTGEVTVCVPHDRGKGSCVDGNR